MIVFLNCANEKNLKLLFVLSIFYALFCLFFLVNIKRIFTTISMLRMAQTTQDEVDIDLTPQELQVLSELDR